MAAEMLADAHARLGRAAEDVALLEELAAGDPLRESLAVRLVTALYAAGRQADALAAFERCRRALADQLGVDPAPALRRVHAAVLAQETPAPAAVAGRVLPVNLPPRNRSFVGREDLLDELDRALDDDTRRPRAIALAGLGGVGKTELALELAHRRHREGRVAWWIAADDPAGTATEPRRPGRGRRHRAVRAGGGRPRGAVGRAGPHTRLGARLRQRRRAAPARALPARRPARRRDHHLAQPRLAAAGPAGRAAAAGPGRVGRLRARAQRRPRPGGRRRAGRAARRPAAGPRAGLRLHRADRDVGARLRAPVPRQAQQPAAA